MDHRKKLLELLGTTSLRKYSEPRTCEELTQMGRYYSEMFDKVAAQGEVQVERVRGEISRLLADAMQPVARQRYGVADAAAIRRLLSEAWDEDARASWGRQMSLIRTAVGQTALSEDRQSAFLEVMEGLPRTIADLISGEIARLKLVPLENLNEITLVLAEMFEEGAHADQRADN